MLVVKHEKGEGADTRLLKSMQNYEMTYLDTTFISSYGHQGQRISHALPYPHQYLFSLSATIHKVGKLEKQSKY